MGGSSIYDRDEWLSGMIARPPRWGLYWVMPSNRVQGLPREGNLDNSTRERLKRLYRWDHYGGNPC